ncbi:hypothetical protein ACWDBT_14060 [Streptomyces ardesiacus]
MIHGDLRADHVLLTDDRVIFVDWPWAAVGASWCDIVLMGPSAIVQDTPDAMRFPSRLRRRGCLRCAASSALRGKPRWTGCASAPRGPGRGRPQPYGCRCTPRFRRGGARSRPVPRRGVGLLLATATVPSAGGASWGTWPCARRC